MICRNVRFSTHPIGLYNNVAMLYIGIIQFLLILGNTAIMIHSLIADLGQYQPSVRQNGRKNMTEIETSFQQAVEAFNSSNLDLAIDLFKTTVSLSPDHADAYNYLGQAYFKKEEYQDSVNSFEKALEIEPTHVQAKENLGVAQWKRDNLSEQLLNQQKISRM